MVKRKLCEMLKKYQFNPIFHDSLKSNFLGIFFKGSYQNSLHLFFWKKIDLRGTKKFDYYDKILWNISHIWIEHTNSFKMKNHTEVIDT